ncbi:MAG: head-tail adaptor protein [Muribaculaceae bacterium]|nr:head-tail adaptor protein [Muribaculaceae bacterium]
MIAGELRELIEIWHLDKIKNELGEEVEVWTVKEKTRAKVIFNSGLKELSNHEIVPVYTNTFEVRIYITISEFDRIKWDDKLFSVISIENNKTRQCKIIQAKMVNE